MLKGLIFSIISATCYGCLPIFGKLGYSLGMNEVEMLQYRFGLGAILLGLWLAFTDPGALRLPKRTLMGVLLMGFLLYPIQGTCFLRSLKTISAATTSLILYFYPVAVTLMAAIFFRQRITRPAAISLIMVTCGCGLVFFETFRQTANPEGIAYALGAMAAFSCNITISQVMLKKGSPLGNTFYVILAAGTAFTVANGGLPEFGTMTPERAALAVSFAIIPTVLAVGMLYLAIDCIGGAYTSIFSTLEPVVTVILAYLLLGEALAPIQLAGAVCIIAGIILPNLALIRTKQGVTS